VKDRIQVVEKILSANDRIAEDNRARLDAAGVLALNFMASPGAGKTSLIERTLAALAPTWTIGVVDGDVASSIDADRAAAAGAKAVQINTGGERATTSPINTPGCIAAWMHWSSTRSISCPISSSIWSDSVQASRY